MTIDSEYYVNVGWLMTLPRPTMKCSLDSDRAETIRELPIVSVSCKDVEYHEDKVNRLY